MDTRFEKRFSFGGRRSLDGMLEVFNLFNRANYGSYTTNVDNAAYGQQVYNSNVAYGARGAAWLPSLLLNSNRFHERVAAGWPQSRCHCGHSGPFRF